MAYRKGNLNTEWRVGARFQLCMREIIHISSDKFHLFFLLSMTVSVSGHILHVNCVSLNVHESRMLLQRDVKESGTGRLGASGQPCLTTVNFSETNHHILHIACSTGI